MIKSKRPTPTAEHPELRGRFRARFIADVLMFLRLGYHFWRGFHFLRNTNRAITIFGSARIPASSPWYEETRKVAHHFSKNHFSIITGGGPSIMEAANRGAFEARADGKFRSIGINIEIPHEQSINSFVSLGLKAKYFFVRKVLLCRYSEAFVIFPGGFGTFDELFEIITLMKTKKMIERPVILVGKDYWSGLMNWFETTAIPYGTISGEEYRSLIWVDSAEEVIAQLNARLT